MHETGATAGTADAFTQGLLTDLLISPAQLADRLADPAWVVVDCRFSLADPALGDRQYATAHIPGAVYAHLDRDLSAPARVHGGRHPLPPLDRLVERLGQWGIDRDTWVAIYDDSRFGFGARLWWLLRYLGHDRAVLLDGGWSAWVEAALPTTAALPQRSPRSFVPQVRPELLATIDDVKEAQRLGEGMLLDSREPARYRGETEPIDPVAGHIPGAVNYPWIEVCDAQGRARSIPALREHFRDIQPAPAPIVYCGSGVTACVNLWALARAGYGQARLYAGSWSDWCSYPELPMITQSAFNRATD